MLLISIISHSIDLLFLQLAKNLSIRKHEQFSPIKYGVEPSSEKVTGSLKFKVKINGTATMKLDGVSISTDL